MSKPGQFNSIAGADLPQKWVHLLNKGLVPPGFGDWMYRRQLSEAQRAGVPVTISAANPVLSASEGGDVGALDDLTNTIHVDANAPSGGDGSRANPFDTITAAEDRAEALIASGDITASAPGAIVVEAGTYAENVYHRAQHCELRLHKNAIIAPATGFPLVITNATKASVAALVAAGHTTLSALDSNYGSLVADGTIPSLYRANIIGGTIQPANLNIPAIVYIGVGDGFDAAFTEREMLDVYPLGSVYIRNASKFFITGGDITYHLWMRQVRSYELSKVEAYSFDVDYNQTDPRPASPHNTSSIGAIKAGCNFVTTATISGEAQVTDRQSYATTAATVKGTAQYTKEQGFMGSLVVQDDATGTIKNSEVGGNVSVNGTDSPTLLLKSSDVLGNLSIAAGGTKSVTQSGGEILGTITDPDGVLVYTKPVDQKALDIDFTAQTTANLKTGGDGNYTYGGHQFAATNVATAQSADLTNGTGLVIQADEDQELKPQSNISNAPQLRRALTALIEKLDVSETDGLRLWMRLTASSLTSVREAVGFGVISSGASPARFVAAIKTASGIDLAHHGPASIAARGEVSADNTPDVLILEKAPGVDVWSVRSGTWSSGWPDIDDTTLLGGVALSSIGTTLVLGAAAGMTRYADLEFVMFVSNVAGAATDYLHAQSAGNRTGTIAVTNTLTTTGAINQLVDGDTTTTTVLRWNNTEAVAGKHVTFDFGSDVYCDEAKFYVASSPTIGHGTWRWEGSNDGLGWDIISADFTLQGSAAGAVIGDLSGNTSNYRYLRLWGVSGSCSNSQWLFEIEFKLSVGVSTGISTDYDATGTFKNLRAEAF